MTEDDVTVFFFEYLQRPPTRADLERVPPPPAERHADVDPVGGQFARPRRCLAYAGDQHLDPVPLQEGFQPLDRRVGDRALRQDHDVDAIDRLARRDEDAVDQFEVELLGLALARWR